MEAASRVEKRGRKKTARKGKGDAFPLSKERMKERDGPGRAASGGDPEKGGLLRREIYSNQGREKERDKLGGKGRGIQRGGGGNLI